MAFDHSRRRWFGTRPCRPVPRGLPSSVKQLRTTQPFGLLRSWRTIIGIGHDMSFRSRCFGTVSLLLLWVSAFAESIHVVGFLHSRLKTAMGWLPPQKQLRGLAVAYSGGLLGALIAPLLVTPIALAYGWRALRVVCIGRIPPVVTLTGVIYTLEKNYLGLAFKSKSCGNDSHYFCNTSCTSYRADSHYHLVHHISQQQPAGKRICICFENRYHSDLAALHQCWGHGSDHLGHAHHQIERRT
jgi:hypothetical protein